MSKVDYQNKVFSKAAQADLRNVLWVAKRLTVVGVGGAQAQHGHSGNHALQDRAAVDGAVEARRVIVDVQKIEVDSYRAGQAASVPGLHRQDEVLLRLVVQRSADVKNAGDRVQEEGGILIILLYRVRDLAVWSRVRVAGQNRCHDRTSMENNNRKWVIMQKYSLTNHNQAREFWSNMLALILWLLASWVM